MLEICCKQISVEGRLVRIARLEGELYVSLKDPDALIQSLQNSGEHVDLFTFMQMLPDTTPKHKFPMEWDNVAALEISTFDQWWNEQLGKKTRNMARQAEKKGVTLREAPFDDALVRGIWGIYNECPIRQGRRFPHYGKDVETVCRMTATFLDRSVFIGAYFEDELIGFIKLTANDTGTQAGLMYILAMAKHRNKSPTNALIAEAVRSCAKRGIRYLLYSHFSYGKKRSDSLKEFKERSGFRRIDLPRYYVPISPLGHIALRLGLHQSLASRVPEPILTKVREWRTAWYKYKFHLEEAG